MGSEFAEVAKWTKVWKLQFSEKRFKTMHLNKKTQKTSYRINDTVSTACHIMSD